MHFGGHQNLLQFFLRVFWMCVQDLINNPVVTEKIQLEP